MKEKGLVQVYTGDGKGKTTACIGLACRAIGHNFKVCWIYFHKEPERFGYGEIKTLEKLGIDIFGFAKKHPYFDKDVTLDDMRRECLKGIEFVKKIYQEDKYDVLILDEILISLRDGLLNEKELLEILDSKPQNLELVLTGRGATEKIINKADLVSDVKNIKHPYDIGIKGREGIEY